MKKSMNAQISGGWLPSNRAFALSYLNSLRDKVKKRKALPADGEETIYRHESIAKFKILIDGDSIIRMYFVKMIDQVPGFYKNNEESGGFYLESIDEMLELLDEILDTAPEYNSTDLVGFPINLILDWTMGMPAGFAAFRIEKLNLMFKEILDEWCQFLDSPASLYVLNDSENGWKCDAAKEQLGMDQYDYDPEDEYWGFKSWNDFFTRRLADGARPIDEPGNSKVIVSACDSQVYSIKDKVKAEDWFWVKSQPYSLLNMLPQKPDDNIDIHYNNYVKPFIGGNVYQAFLSATKYHRWHSPVSGKIEKAYITQGTYYSQAESEGVDPAGPNDSQGYITHVATRAIIFIKAEDPVGLMCIMPVGMAEVSSCILSVEEGDYIEKGQELGYFQYGGSTYCLIFRPGIIQDFNVSIDASPQMGEQIAIAK